jgi:hypothetical protein
MKTIGILRKLIHFLCLSTEAWTTFETYEILHILPTGEETDIQDFLGESGNGPANLRGNFHYAIHDIASVFEEMKALKRELETLKSTCENQVPLPPTTSDDELSPSLFLLAGTLPKY